MEFVLPIGHSNCTNIHKVGSKAANISILKASGFPVPSGFIITVDAMETYLTTNGLKDQVLQLVGTLESADNHTITEVSHKLRTLIMSGEFTGDLKDSIVSHFVGFSGKSSSVRSSSTLEDRAGATFAGQHDTFLNVLGEESLWYHLKQVWASLWTERAIHYASALRLPIVQMKMAVIVQELIPAHVSGVAFTLDPITGDTSKLSVSAAFGLGESTVSGAVTPDSILLQRNPTKVIRYSVGKKQSKIEINPAGGTLSIDLPDHQSKQPCLSKAQSVQIAKMALTIEGEFDNIPQDIEWAIFNNELFLLQARPLSPAENLIGSDPWESPVEGAHWRRTWRLGEWLSDPVTPLFSTWTLPMLVESREEFGTGILDWEVKGSFSMPKPWFCLINGYFYTRQDRPPRPSDTGNQQDNTNSPSLGERVAQRGRGNKTHLDKWRDEYLPAYLTGLQKHLEFNIAEASSQQLISFVNTLTKESGEFWYLMAPIGYGFEESGFNPYYESVVPSKNRPHYVTLFIGYPSKVMEAQEHLYSIAQNLRNDRSLSEWFSDSSAEQLVELAESWPSWLRNSINYYVQAYGHQVFTLDFYFPTSGERIEDIVNSIQTYLKHDAPSPWKIMEEAAAGRERASIHALQSLADNKTEREYLKDAIEGFQACASSREDAAFYFQRPSTLIRQCVLKLGSRLKREGIIEEIEQVFFLEKNELDLIVENLALGISNPSYAENTGTRKHIWERQRLLSAPDRIPMDLKIEGLDHTPEVLYDATGIRIIGNAASPGRAQGKARVIKSQNELNQFSKGEILISNAASPSLTPLLLIAGGIVTEAGGGASHSTLIARELGVPAVTNAGNVTQLISTGQLIEIDGSNGIVKILDHLL